MEAINKRHPLDVASIFKEYGKPFLDCNQLCADQLKAFNAIVKCRSAAMGGHLDACGQCGHQRIAYNSCRNRHCNKCQYTKQLIWIDKLQSSLPVCRYFHLVFTIPRELHKLFYLNQRTCYDLLFKATSQTLQKVGLRFLKAQTGAVAVLHTWGQALTYHPHIHMLVPAGGLSVDGAEWINAPKKFFLPVKALSGVFRGVLWDLLKEADGLKLPDGLNRIAGLKKQLYANNWNVYAKKTLAGPQSVVRYLGGYTHRVAISNSRLVSMDKGTVTFRWKDYRKGPKNQLLSLDANEFIGRFMRHILPSGFYKIRYYGLLAAANQYKKNLCQQLINKPLHTPMLQGIPVSKVLTIVTGKDPGQCPKCKTGRLLPKTILDPI